MEQNQFQKIIDELQEDRIIRLMKMFGVEEYEDTPKALIFPTICHNVDISEASKKLYYYKDKKFFMCYTEDGGMSIFKFLETYYKTRQIEYNWYTDIYEVALRCSTFADFVEGFELPTRENLVDRYRRKKKEVDLKPFSNNVLDVFIKKYPYEWLKDGISCEAMDKFGIKFSISQNKIIIPHYDINGNLVGIRGRALNQWEVDNVGKYAPVQVEKTWYKHPLSLNLYGLYENQENIRQTGICYIFEAEKSVLQFESFSLPNCAVAVCGSNLNKYQIYLLTKFCAPKEIVICFDKEEEKGSSKYFDKIYKLCSKYLNYCNFSFIYDMDNLLGMKDSPSDKGEDVFRSLLDRRVKVR